MKNTEWGAVAYLAQSVYGKNTEVWINPNSNYLTGHAGSGPSVEGTTSTSPYNSGNGPQASTTGNVYGVYDMSGGTEEFTAAYVANNNASLTNYGSSLVSGADYTKDVYISSVDTKTENYDAAISKYGDAMYETSNHYSSSNGSWYRDFSHFSFSDTPFFVRGGSHVTKYPGIFCFDFNRYTSSGSSYGFRPVLLVL